MQFSHSISLPFKKPIFRLLQIGASLLCFYFIVQKFQQQELAFSQMQVPSGVVLLILVVFALAIVNWVLEAKRWQLSLSKVERMSLWESTRVVLAGLSLNWVLPYTSGDFVVRMAHMKDKVNVGVLALINRGVMIALTVAMGMFGLAIYFEKPYLALVSLGIALLFVIGRLWVNNDYLGKIKLDKPILDKVTFLSLARYLVFTLQFVVLLLVYNPTLPFYLILGGVGFIFLSRTVIPGLFGGAGIREASGILFFEPYVTSPESIVAPILIIWLINLVIPSFVGGMMLLRLQPGAIK